MAFQKRKELKSTVKISKRKVPRCKRYRSRGLRSFLQMECNGLAEDEMEEIRKLLEKMNRKRKQNMEPCLLFDVRFH